MKKIFYLLLLFPLIALGAPNTSQTLGELLGGGNFKELYHFDGNGLNDSGLNAADQVLQGGVTSTAGYFGGGLSLATSSRQYSSSSVNTGITGNPIFSVGCWFNTASKSQEDLITIGNSNGGTQFNISINDSAPNMIAVSTGAASISTATGTFTTNQWTSVIFSKNSANQPTSATNTAIYINGLSKTFSSAITLNIQNRPTLVGQGLNYTNGGFDGNFNGKIDECFVASSSLSASQVQSMYNMQRGRIAPKLN